MAGVRFEDVDLLGAISRIVDLHTQHYKEDFDLDKELISKLAVSDRSEDKQLLWMSRPCGTYSMLNFVNDTESEVRLDYLKQFCMTDNDIELIAPLPENQNYIDFMFEIASHGKNEEILMAVLPCMLSYSYIFRKLAAVPTSRQSRYWDFIKDYADEQYAESCKEWSAFAEHKCAGLSVANKKYLADIFEKASLLELAFWKMAYRNERMEENAK